MLFSFHRAAYLLIIPLLLQNMVSCSSPNQSVLEKKVYIKKTSERYQLIRNGMPFEIKGVCGSSHLTELKEGGGNTIRVYDTTGLENKLDEANKLGITVIVDIPLQIKNLNVIDPNAINWISEFVKRYKDKPALLYWMLGNEVYFPKFFDNNFIDEFNTIAEAIHTIDPNHPVSTAVSTGAIKEILTLNYKNEAIDFISINIFGRLNDFENVKKLLFLWQGPYVISEWGNNGPWESNTTTWLTPLEQTSTAKAEQIKDRYLNYIAPIDDGRYLGSLAFYWGQKQETTHTWFSIFPKKGRKTQVFFELENFWQNKHRIFTGPLVNKIMLNKKENWGSILCTPGELMSAHISIDNLPENHHFEWEIIPENWFLFSAEYKNKLSEIPNLVELETVTDINFRAPITEGPYRLYYSIENQEGYVANANIPFYVIGKAL